VRQGQLLRELSPHSMQALRAHNPPDPALRVNVQSVVTVAPELTLEQDGVLRVRDKLFAALHAATGQRPWGEPTLPLNQAQKLLRTVADARIVRHPSARLPAFDSSINDGVVNATRQLLLTRGVPEQSLACLAIADHADVVGCYDRPSVLAEGSPSMGMMCSGANFGDDQFFQLWGLIAQRIASVALGIEARSPGSITKASAEVAAQ
jgi:hypothetical protein